MGGCSGGVFACLALASALSLSPVGQQAQATTATSIPGDDAQHRPAGINWVDGSVDQAFERAQREQRLVFLYWGAVWCPPCNQLKATVFRSPGFIERMRSFVPVYIDGDAPGAQALGARFQVIGYPTTLVLRADGQEISRLPGEVDPQRYVDALDAALHATHPVHDLLADALAGRRTLNQDEWRLLALYSWETDQRQLVPEGNAAETVARLALACPARRRDSRDRLTLKALALSAGSPATLTVPGVGAVPKSGRTAQDASRVSALIQVAREGVGVARRVLRDPALARRHLDLLTDAPDKLVGLLAPGNLAQQRALALQWDRAMSGLAQDAGLSNLDRLSALGARVALARRDTPDATVRAALPPELIAELRAAVLRADRTATGNAERPAVISNATELLAEAGLLDESDALLKAELARSPSPYYLMLGLADNARRRHDGSAALDWYARAHAGAQGPATRLQWGASHVRALIEFAPDDAGRIESTVSGVLAEIEPVPASFEARNRNSLERLGRRIGAWGAAPEHAASLARLRAQWQAMCERVPAQTPQRAICAQAL